MSTVVLTAPPRPNALFLRVSALGAVVAYAVGWAVHNFYLNGSSHLGHLGRLPEPRLENLTPAAKAALASHAGLVSHHGESAGGSFLRDATLSVPLTLAVLLLAVMLVRKLTSRNGVDADSMQARLGFAVAAATLAAIASIPFALVQNGLDGGVLPTELGAHLAGVALATLRYTFAITLGASLFFGVPWKGMESHS
ncbi:hypothetical protein [Tenggerimyces flavus]|uniref:Uncharacterized protein n=1 Tax=Tenggerimyces flavus TaxID=1708749 RepID=A0ABV7YHP8_9ACTN|nr:hypothetical protein [Tenggerimyces flavus]MBM7783915.1 hypothetical protein [Tenggerimyces flavus]